MKQLSCSLKLFQTGFGSGLTVGPVGLLDAAVVRNVLPLRVDAVQLQADLGRRVVAVLADDARGLVQELLLGLGLPPVPEVAVGVVLPALVVEAVRDLVADDPADAAVVQVRGPILVEEDALGEEWGKMANSSIPKGSEENPKSEAKSKYSVFVPRGFDSLQVPQGRAGAWWAALKLPFNPGK